MRNDRLLAALIVATIAIPFSFASAEDAAGVRKSHPLDPALKIARDGLDTINRNIQDYTCTIVKRERVGGVLGEHQFMEAKIRNRQEKNGQIETPLSVYLKFLQPKAVAGREVIWVEGENNGKLIAHESGLLNLKRVYLAPTGPLAMYGQRYPIYEIGVKNLIEKLIEKGERDRQRDECEVSFFNNAKVDKTPCQMIQVIHPVRRSYFDFYKAQIYIDSKLQVPIRFVAWTWPESEGGEPVLQEEYTYVNIKLNVGLTDADFDPSNSEYNFPRL